MGMQIHLRRNLIFRINGQQTNIVYYIEMLFTVRDLTHFVKKQHILLVSMMVRITSI